MPSTITLPNIARLTQPIASPETLQSHLGHNDDSVAKANAFDEEQWKRIAENSHGCIACTEDWEYHRYFSPDRHEPLSYPLPEGQMILLEPFESE